MTSERHGPEARAALTSSAPPALVPPDLTGLRLALIGSRGYPSTYGGFETMVRKLAPYLTDCGAQVTVYGRGQRSGREQIDGVTVVNTRGVDRKSTSTLSYGATSALDARKHRPDAALVLNVANGYWLPMLKQAGIPTMVNVDGIEWRRGKWNAVAKRVFWYGAKLTARYADQIVCDSTVIASIWREQFGVDGTYIPYGADVETDIGSDGLLEHGIVAGKYVLMVSRLVPENNVSLFLDATTDGEFDPQVVMVGSAVGPSPIEDRLRELNRAGRVIWLGHVHDQELLAQLWANAAVYFHGHSAGGTNPALLQAIGYGAPVVALDTAFNREVLGPDGHYISDAPGLRSTMDDLWDHADRHADVERNRTIAAERYSWESVQHAYATNLLDLATRTRPAVSAGLAG